MYPKGLEGRWVNNQQFIEKLEKHLVKDIRDACARNNNPRVKPKSSDTKSSLKASDFSFTSGSAGSNLVILIPLAKGRRANCIFRLPS